MQMDCAEEAVTDEFDDWYDHALKNGMGFKSQEEKAEYLASIGDPLKHPMFATSAEDLADNPLVDAIRALREEDKSKVELATMYKEDANALVKKSKSADSQSGTLHEAINTYSFALTFLDAAEKARADGTEDEKDKTADLNFMKSQILSNKAQVWLTLGNYRSCINDCNLSLAQYPGNAKSFYRKCKALQSLRKYDECIDCCNTAQAQLQASLVPESNTSNASEISSIVAIKNQCIEEKHKLDMLAEKKRQQQRELEQAWEAIWKYKLKRDEQLESSNRKMKASTLKNRYPDRLTNNITLGFCSEIPPVQFQDVYPEIDPESGFLCVPILFLYPQHNQLDAIQAAKADSLLVEYLAEMFPEFEDGATAVNWDIAREYQSSKLLVYCPVYQSPSATNVSQWTAACMERRQVQGLEGSAAAELAKDAISKRGVNINSPVANASSISSTQVVGFVEVHIGCSIEQTLRLPGCVLAGGILSLLAFVKGNESHRQFLKSCRENGFQLMKLQPNEAISLLG